METVTLIIAAINLLTTVWLVKRIGSLQPTYQIVPIEFVELTAEEIQEVEQESPDAPVLNSVPVETPPEQINQTGAWVNRKGIPLSGFEHKPQPPIKKDPNQRPYGWSS